MKGYSSDIPENCASARLEDINASFKDLAQVCGRIRHKKADWALEFLEKAAEGDVPVMYKGHNKRLGHRRELCGRKGRYPKKAARIVLKVLQSAIANGRVKGLGEIYTILVATANKRHIYPRLAPKGRWARSFLETARVEIILEGSEIPKGVTVTPPKKKEPEKKPEAKKEEVKKEEKPEAKKEPEKKEEVPKKEEKEAEAKPAEKKEERPQPELLKRESREHHEHKHDEEKAHEQEKKRKEMPHQHGEHDKR